MKAVIHVANGRLVIGHYQFNLIVFILGRRTHIQRQGVCYYEVQLQHLIVLASMQKLVYISI